MWDQIKQIYKEKFNVDPEIVELLAVMDILNACVTGLSNKSIAECFDLDEKYIMETLQKYLNFPGWCLDLDKNPLRVYNILDGNYYAFLDVWDLYVYEMCTKYKEYERKLNDEYYRFA
jgi:hypothetical protein